MNKILLCILDGVGIREESYGNAFQNAKKPNFDYLWNNYPHSLLNASEQYVGLPKGQMGNSEVGHTNIGAGRIVYQSLELINQKFKDKTIENDPSLNELFKYVKENNRPLHIIGLFSDGGVHSHIDHFINMLNIANNNDIKNIYAHIITDGRDTKDNIATSFVDIFNKNKVGKIASISGRYYAMDRDKRYERTNLYYDTITNKGKNKIDIYDYIATSYKNNCYDEFIKPSLIDPDGYIDKNDAVIWINFRPDRAIQIVEKLEKHCKVLSLMYISDQIKSPYIIKKQQIEDTLGEYLSSLDYHQLRIAETEKYAHVTYFFDGGKELDLKNCDKVLIPSKKVATYDLEPSMSAYEITDKLLSIIDDYDFIVLNFANGDMVGHTGNYDATIKAIETIDNCLGKIIHKTNEINMTLIVTADHGNCDYMIDNMKAKVTTHSLSKVPFIIAENKINLTDGNLSDIAPTILALMNLKIPKSMTGNILIIK